MVDNVDTHTYINKSFPLQMKTAKKKQILYTIYVTNFHRQRPPTELNAKLSEIKLNPKIIINHYILVSALIASNKKITFH